MSARPLRIFTAVWGQTHIDWFERACARSLSWPKNRASLKGATWNIVSKAEDAARVMAIAEKIGVNKLEFSEIPPHVQGATPEMGSVLLNALFSVMGMCLKDGSQMLTAPPDTIFSDGSIPNLLKMGEYGSTCVAVAHPRVSPSIFGGIKESPLESAALVSLAMKHAHIAWAGSEFHHEKQNSFIGGIAWQRLSDKLYAVQHRLPTVYLANFLPSDFSYFQQPHDNLPPTYGAWDHAWPTELFKQERQRTVGSSDAVFIVEVTREDANIPPVVLQNKMEPDAFWRSQEHNKINRQFVTIFRGE